MRVLTRGLASANEQMSKMLPSERVTDSTAVTQAGYAADARQLNPSVDGTIASRVASMEDRRYGQGIVAYATFAHYGDYWWGSSPIPCPPEESARVALCGNVRNNEASGECLISQQLFEVRRGRECFFLWTNDRDVAGHLFENVRPGRVWEVYYNVTRP